MRVERQIKLPAHTRNLASVEGNPLYHVLEPEGTEEIVASTPTDTLVSCTSRRGRTIELVLPRKAEPASTDRPILRLPSGVTSVTTATSLKWLSHPHDSAGANRDLVRESWIGALRLIDQDVDSGGIGFREPQLGALHAVLAHWSVKQEPALLVMPTGTGKTETMMAVVLYKSCDRVLILVPSQALRWQIAMRFASWGRLRDMGVLRSQAVNPVVGILQGGIKNAGNAGSFADKANVIITTPDSLSACEPTARAVILERCSHLFVDEAHHLAARTWKAIAEQFAGKPSLLFTATPFRRDGERIEGSIIYNYPLGRAQERKLFRPVHYRPVHEADETKADRKIAEAAVAQLQADLKAKYDHMLLARVASVPGTEKIEALYKAVTKDLASEFQPVVVHSQLSRGEVVERTRQIESRARRIVICVDMFGEGFDLPQLKIAAMHDMHRTLPITLQFIGRFTRTAKNVGDASVVVNDSDPRVEPELRELYSQDANWNELLRRSSEKRIEKEVELQELIASFEGSLPGEIPLWNLRPSYSTIVYTSPNGDWYPNLFEDSLPAAEFRKVAISKKERIAVAVLGAPSDVTWGKYRNIKNWTWYFLIIHHWKEKKLLFIHASDYDFVRPQRIAERVAGAGTEPLTGPRVYRVFGGIERPMMRNVGASQTGSVRFTMYFGPDVAAGISLVEAGKAVLTNVFGWGYEGSEQVTRGCSERKGKVWERGGCPVPGWRDWVHEVGAKLLDKSIEPKDMIAKFLKPEEFSEYKNLVPLSVQWGEHISTEDEERISVVVNGTDYKLTRVSLDVVEFKAAAPLIFVVRTPDSASTFVLTVGKTPDDQATHRYELKDGPDVLIKKGSSSDPVPLIEWMARDPVVFTYEDGSFSYNHFFVRAECLGAYDQTLLRQIDWSGINIRKESEGKARENDAIQYRVIDQTKADFDLVFNDDDSGEAADVIAVRFSAPDSLVIRLIHCKFSSEDKPGARVDDLYAVCGQAQKSIHWYHIPFEDLCSHIRHREKLWQRDSHTRFIKGDLAVLKGLERSAKNVRPKLEVVVVQPGLLKSKVSSEILKLLGSTELYLKKTTEANLQVWCS